MQSSRKKSQSDGAQYSLSEQSSKFVCGKTDAGKVRPHNEDCFLISNEKKLYIVSDGMGGYEAGEIASRITKELVNEYFTQDLITMLLNGDKDIGSELKLSLLTANQKILEMSEQTPAYRGMGCTIVIALIIKDVLHLCHVGDSRAYVATQSEIHLTTTDHSAVMELVRSGRMTLDEARKSPAKNRLSQAVGARGPVEPEYSFFRLEDGDKILLCSDGLWDMLSDKEIFQILKKKKTVKYYCDELVKAANKAGGQDNITVVVIHNRAKEAEDI
ncbi:MAG: Stp1/IreP family PP2C-type Ser/Thr phosphatase [Desulfocapsaceae bacterium]